MDLSKAENPCVGGSIPCLLEAVRQASITTREAQASLFLCFVIYLQVMDKTYYVYVLRSLMDATLYVGMSEDVVKRLDEYNKGKSQFTKAHQPWELIYSELVGTRELARKREK
jgi:hypothetical protein